MSEQPEEADRAVQGLPSPVLITGVTGFIAAHLAERLVRAGVAVRGTARRPAAAAWLAEQGVEVVQADLLDPPALHRAAAGCRAVVHAAAWTGGGELTPAAAWDTNVTGTTHVLAAARAAGAARVVYLSSVAVYGLNRGPLVNESAFTPPVGQLYPDSKIAAEAAVRAAGLPAVIVRPACTYGPRGTAWTLGPLDQIRRGQLVLLGRDTGLVTPGYIENVIEGLLLTLTQPAALGETFNLCDDRAVTYRAFYLAYAAMLGKARLPTVPGPLALLALTAPANALRRWRHRPPIGPWSLHFRRNPAQFSIAKAQRLLNYQPRISFAEGMRRTEAWLRAAGHLPERAGG